VFEEAVGLCSSPDPIVRAVGADILAQLGVREGVAEYPFADESVPTLVSLLGDTEPHVTMSALYALGHLGKGEPLQLARLANHPSEDIRCALAYALGGRTDDVSIDTEIRLSEDQDVDAQAWPRACHYPPRGQHSVFLGGQPASRRYEKPNVAR
jgi:HEAT repeat protein